VIFPGENERRIVIAILSFCVGLSLGLVAKISDVQFKDYLPSVVTLVAAFSGAWAAYLLQRRKELEQRVEERVDAGNKAIFALMRCHNRFISIQRQAIDPFRQHPARFVAIRPIIGEMVCGLELDYESLSFLFKSKNPNMLNELSSTQAEVESTINLINQRSEIHFNYVQPVADQAGFQNGQDVTLNQINAALGHRLSETMKDLTDQLIEFVDLIVSDTEKVIAELHDLLKSEFKGHAIVKMEKPNKSKQQGPAAGTR
tara:strand:+ start:2873 stop:3646 length:774 start_codon:yes stop_codon:yes gene_type:complete